MSIFPWDFSPSLLAVAHDGLWKLAAIKARAGDVVVGQVTGEVLQRTVTWLVSRLLKHYGLVIEPLVPFLYGKCPCSTHLRDMLQEVLEFGGDSRSPCFHVFPDIDPLDPTGSDSLQVATVGRCRHLEHILAATTSRIEIIVIVIILQISSNIYEWIEW